jgi:ElaB/YqjD/DUF883 family membrane-anchored ribosome-binding protein
MNMGQLLKASANAVQAAILVKRTTSDVVRSAPYASMAAVLLVAACAGFLLGRRLRSG